MKVETPEAKPGRIKPEAIARKLAAIRNRENLKSLKQIETRPRLIEMLWYLQAMSIRPGGLCKFAEDLIEANPGQVGTKTMRAAKTRNYSAVQRLEIYREMDGRSMLQVEGQERLDAFTRMHMPDCEIEDIERKNDLVCLKALKDVGPEKFETECRRGALLTIPEYLVALCTDLETDFSNGESLDQKREWRWCFGDVIEAVLEMMERTSAGAKKQIAMTEVSKRVFREMDYALQEKVMVRIEGASGFGKTESLIAWCEARPGAARLVRVPSSNSMKDFMIAVGKALGIECSFGSSVTGLREKVDYVLEHSGLMIILDECAFLIPLSYVKTSSPPRLEWVRDKILDRGLPLVLSSTPTKWKSYLDRFQKKTGYTLEEFFRRNFLTVVLPSALSEADMIDAARIHFPQLDDDQLGLIANEARLSQNYLQAVEAISKRVRFLSVGKRISLNLIEQAISDYFGRIEPKKDAPLKGSLRPVKPASNGDFQPRSLRGTVPETTVAELISADS